MSRRFRETGMWDLLGSSVRVGQQTCVYTQTSSRLGEVIHIDTNRQSCDIQLVSLDIVSHVGGFFLAFPETGEGLPDMQDTMSALFSQTSGQNVQGYIAGSRREYRDEGDVGNAYLNGFAAGIKAARYVGRPLGLTDRRGVPIFGNNLVAHGMWGTHLKVDLASRPAETGRGRMVLGLAREKIDAGECYVIPRRIEELDTVREI